MITVKTCTKCKENKSIDLFGKNTASKDGHHHRCKECCNKHAIEYRLKNPEKFKESKRKYRENHPEKIKKYQKEYCSSNPEKYKNYSYKRRSTKLANGVFKVTDKELKKLYTSNCFYCDSNDYIQIDHVVPISRGGQHSIGNLVAACRKCNTSKNNKFLTEWKLNSK